MIAEQDVFLKILAYGLSDNIFNIPSNVDTVDWNRFYSFCESQAILGIGLQCIDKLKCQLGGRLRIPQDLLFQWIGVSEQIKVQNQLLDKRTKELTDFLVEKGKQSCILKGQRNALLYPDPMLRTPGDIDVWLEGTKKEVVEFVHKDYPQINVEYHHMQYPVFDDVEVEIHYYPSYSYNKWHNYRLQQFFQKEGEKLFEKPTDQSFCIPTMTFNVVFQLSHMMRHFFTQGIGLRHAIDYYYLLQQFISDEQKREIIDVLKKCGMYKFFCSVMWIEISVLGLDKYKDMVPIHEHAGQLILREMLKCGNFGHQYKHSGKTPIYRFSKQIMYNLQYVLEFPSEPICRPISLVWDYIKKRVVVY